MNIQRNKKVRFYILLTIGLSSLAMVCNMIYIAATVPGPADMAYVFTCLGLAFSSGLVLHRAIELIQFKF